MSTLWITEFSGAGVKNAGRGFDASAPVAREPAGADQAVTFGTSSPVAASSSAAFDAATRIVRVISDADCHVVFGDVSQSPGPTATTGKQKLIAGVAEWRAIDPDSVTGLSVYPAA